MIPMQLQYGGKPVPDIVDKATRSRMMAGIRGKNTKHELAIRKALYRRGFRYRLHSSKIPGKPDLVFHSRKAVIFVHGCFWHGHECSLFRLPSTRTDFWEKKIDSNRERDRKVSGQLSDLGWRQLVIWECAMRGKNAESLETVAERAAGWLRSKKRNAVIRGPIWR
jgi:DNA mismatch endonuclease, patch repair protein